MSAIKTQVEMEMHSTEKQWKILDKNIVSRLKKMNELITIQGEKIQIRLEMNKINQSYLSMNMMLEEETLRSYELAKTARKEHKELLQQAEDYDDTYQHAISGRDLYTDIFEFLLTRWKRNNKCQAAQLSTLKTKIFKLHHQEKCIRKRLHRAKVEPLKTNEHCIYKPPRYLSDLVNIYRLRDYRLDSPCPSSSDEENLNIE